ncbi:MAG: cytidylate kinase [Methanosaeta sp. PtaB.Bin039]|nr:MAG: cytidylate kinase [Methanosaeta sp. PtaB.Bin039]HOT07497.1 AAA family ATPase [Methanotrichaceae archaeon]HQF16978.1 AAA family ATPase [Methanotrichaceae archaeon]HQI91598.1 AAA family ATPase [Methanotrichaceae archaeon]HQJ28908.1 AAA family ATPase [Methanotrichaceae archaeon]
MIITISGPPGSGTSTLARALAAELGLRYVNSGEIFRRMATEKGITLKELGRLAEKGPEVDYLIDDAQRELAREGGGIFEGRLSGHVLEADLKIMLKTDLRVRAERIARRENKLFEDSLAESRSREECEARRYKKYYNIDMDDCTVYDLVIDTDRWNEQGTLAISLSAVRCLEEGGLSRGARRSSSSQWA